ncbi:MAG TPA: winged helix-turn-helix domain-containing protein [candidate division Zixibacteria bacterium]|nr:winged helix-turn-helix domain-containing protein [candidate division Zixibacteria bacterium]
MTRNVGTLTIHRPSRQVSVNGRDFRLSTAEFDLLWYLAGRAGEVVTRDELFQQVLGFEYNGLDRTVDLRVSRIRKRIGDNSGAPRLIKSVRSEGYLLVAPEEHVPAYEANSK